MNLLLVLLQRHRDAIRIYLPAFSLKPGEKQVIFPDIYELTFKRRFDSFHPLSVV
jgi:hypothetical protein